MFLITVQVSKLRPFREALDSNPVIADDWKARSKILEQALFLEWLEKGGKDCCFFVCVFVLS